MSGSAESPPNGPGIVVIPPPKTEHPSPLLPFTGADLTGFLLFGACAVAAGTWALRRARKA